MGANVFTLSGRTAIEASWEKGDAGFKIEDGGGGMEGQWRRKTGSVLTINKLIRKQCKLLNLAANSETFFYSKYSALTQTHGFVHRTLSFQPWMATNATHFH